MFNLHEYMLFISYSAIKGDEHNSDMDTVHNDTRIVKKKFVFKKKEKACKKV